MTDLVTPSGAKIEALTPLGDPPDPNEGRVLTEAYRRARRALAGVAAASIAWATRQLDVESVAVVQIGTLNLEEASVPLLLGAALTYLTFRWGIEYAMMPRHTRRWPLARLDFKLTWFLTRVALVVLAGGALNRSLVTTARVSAVVLAQVVAALLVVLIALLIVNEVAIWLVKRKNPDDWFYPGMRSEGWWAVLIGMAVFGVGSAALISVTGQDPVLRQLFLGTAEQPRTISLVIFFLVFVGVLSSPIWQARLLRKVLAEHQLWRPFKDPLGKIVHMAENRQPESLL